jgi:hypothetical protein
MYFEPYWGRSRLRLRDARVILEEHFPKQKHPSNAFPTNQAPRRRIRMETDSHPPRPPPEDRGEKDLSLFTLLFVFLGSNQRVLLRRN